MRRLLGGVVFVLGVAVGAWVLPHLGREPAASAEPAPTQRPPSAAKAKESLVLYQSGEGWEEVPGDGAAKGEKDVNDLGLIVKGVSRVRFQGKVYAVDREGLYRFMVMPQSVQNLISLRDGKSPVPLLMALSACKSTATATTWPSTRWASCGRSCGPSRGSRSPAGPSATCSRVS